MVETPRLGAGLTITAITSVGEGSWQSESISFSYASAGVENPGPMEATQHERC